MFSSVASGLSVADPQQGALAGPLYDVANASQVCRPRAG